MFIVLKLVEWSHLIAEGFTIDTQAGSIFYVATGAHGLHVFVGLLVMLFMIFKADVLENGYDEHNGQGIEYFGLYLALRGFGVGCHLPGILFVLRR